MFKNVASQQIVLLAIDTATNTPKTGDAANITAYLSKDYGTVTVLGDTSATEMDATNAPGLYKFDVTQTESNCDVAVFSAKSSTSGVRIVPVTVFMRPANATALSIDSSGRLDMAKLAGQTITAAAGVTFPSSIASPTNITAGTITTVTNLTNAPTNGDFTATMKTSITTAATAATPSVTVSDKTGFKLASDGLGLVTTWTVGITGDITGNVSGSIGSVATGGITSTSFAAGAIDAAVIATDAIGSAEISAAAVAKIQSGLMLASSYTAPPSAATISTQVQTDLGTGSALTSLASQSSVNTLAAYVDTEVAAILDAVSSSGVVLSAAQMNKIADHVHRRNMANVEASSSGDTLSLSSQYGAIQQAQESSLSGVTLTVKKTDGSTTLGTKTVTTSSSADPITGIS